MSISLFRAISQEGLYVVHLHNLNSRRISEQVDNYLRNRKPMPYDLVIASALSQKISEISFTVISPLRQPFIRALSEYGFHNSVDNIRPDHLLNYLKFQAAPLKWYDDHLLDTLGIDIRQARFERGSATVFKGRHKALFFKMDQMDDAGIHAVVREFLDCPSLKIPRENENKDNKKQAIVTALSQITANDLAPILRNLLGLYESTESASLLAKVGITFLPKRH